MKANEKDVKKRFTELVEAWDRHCQASMFSSNINDYLNHDAFQELVALGAPIIPLVIERYRRDDDPRWGFLLEEITHAGLSDNRRSFQPQEMKKRWLEWWDKKQASAVP
ncbi:MAG: hypothetical protein KF861_11360 [Planctomycetaceae bacterium]|nr:hypothetical protein [Planctomycetaceae bacterium]